MSGPHLDPPVPGPPPPPPAVGTGGCSAADPESGPDRPVLGAAYTKPYRWEVLPDPNPYCERVEALGEADTRDAAEAALRHALGAYASAFGFLYEVRGGAAGAPPQVQELARLATAPPAPKPPAW